MVIELFGKGTRQLSFAFVVALALNPGFATSEVNPSGAQTQPQEEIARDPARELFHAWWAHRRYPDSNDIPGGLIEMLGEYIDRFLSDISDRDNGNARAVTERLREYRQQLKGERDWSYQNARALIKDICRLHPTPVLRFTEQLKLLEQSQIGFGTDYNENNAWFHTIVWGQPASNGLRAGIGLEEADVEYQYLPGKSWTRSVVLHNTGEQPLLICIPRIFSPEALSLQVRDANGTLIPLVTAEPEIQSDPTTFLLKPGQYSTVAMASVLLGVPGQDGKIDNSKGGHFTVSFAPELIVASNPLLALDGHDPELRSDLIRTAITITRPWTEKNRVRARYLSHRLCGVELTDETWKQFEQPGGAESFESYLVQQPAPHPIAGSLPGFEVTLQVDSVSAADGEIELESHLTKLTQWDDDRRQRHRAAYDNKDQTATEAILREEPPYERFFRMLQLAEKWPESETAFAAAMLTMKTIYGPDRDTAMEILVQHHAENSRMDEAIVRSGYTGRGKEWARKILEVNRNPSVIAHCKWRIGPERPRWHDPIPEDAIAFYEEMIRDHGDIPYHVAYWGIGPPASLIGEMALQAMSKIRSRQSVGDQFPDLVGIDLSGEPIAISDYRGKTTLIVYWTSWCGPCLELAQMERRMLERYRGKPFEILGICGDFDLQNGTDEPDDERMETFAAEVRDKARLHGLIWRSMRNTLPDGRKVSDLLGFPSLPYTLLIDGEGVIRSNSFINGTSNDPTAAEELLMLEIEKVLGGKWEHEEHLKRIKREHRSHDAWRRLQSEWSGIATSLESGNEIEAISLLKQLLADESAAGLKPDMLNHAAWSAYERHQVKPLLPSTLESFARAAATAVEKEPENPYFLGTHAHLLYAAGDLDQALKLQQRAVELADPQDHAKFEPFLEELRREKEN